MSGDEDDAEVLAGLRPLHNHVRELRHNRLQALRGENTDGLELDCLELMLQKLS